MSPKSRHAPLDAAYHYQDRSRHTDPRHQALPGYSTSFGFATQDANMIESNFALSSSTSRSRHRAEPTQWNVLAGSPPQADGFISTGFNAMNVTESYNSVAMMNADVMDPVYGMAATHVNQRHTPLSDMDQAQAMTEDFMMQEFISGMDYPACTATMDTSMVAADSWTRNFDGRPPSPPDEEVIALRLRRHGMYPQEPMDCEPLNPSQSQRYSVSRHSVVQPRPIRPHMEREDSQHSSRHAASPQSPPEDSVEKTKARKDPLYDAPCDSDGWFRCPLVEQFGCSRSHKPTKQRCIYAKYLDSHLRPYKCRYAGPKSDCAEARFSSNACLFRHEREAHGKHGHGENPFLCKYANCPRAKPDNGFPRSWNQKDHMKRVHQWDPETDEEEQQSLGRHAPEAKRRKGAGSLSSVQMKRSNSSYYGRTSMASYPREARHGMAPSRHQAVTYNPMQTGNMMEYTIPMDDMQLEYSLYQSTPSFAGYSQAVY